MNKAEKRQFLVSPDVPGLPLLPSTLALEHLHRQVKRPSYDPYGKNKIFEYNNYE